MQLDHSDLATAATVRRDDGLHFLEVAADAPVIRAAPFLPWVNQQLPLFLSIHLLIRDMQLKLQSAASQQMSILELNLSDERWSGRSEKVCFPP